MTFNHSFMDEQPAGKSLDVLVRVIPFSEKMIALLFPVSCDLLHKSEGNDNGCPEILIAGGAKAKLKELAGTNAIIHLSITDQENFSAAMVIIEKQ